MATFGNYALIAALVVNLYCAVAFVTGFLLRRPRLVESAQGGMRAIFLLVTAASAALVYALMTHDFRIEYVAAYSSRDMPAPYLFAAWWGGQNGSMLFWAWILGLYALIVSFYRRRHPELIPYVLMVLNFNLTLFLGLMASANNPFRLLPFVPNDGNGLNPLLQNPTMVIHPPMLYLGYVGFVVPFAFCMAALLSGRLGDEWIKATRRWTILSWFFLGVGMLLGGRWAYVELGWGGYWAWDPVENASFMPWLTGTAFLHSVMIQEKRRMLKIWNVVLIVLTFALCIFGTFLTRSGVVSSVHAFARTHIGPYFLFFIAISVLFAFSLLFWRRKALRSEAQLDSILSRESAFLLNNLVLLGACFAVFWGTIFPVISEAVRGVKITVGPPFFNKVNIPIGLFL
ncbi:MAG: heme lyase CcmF/NrfE family subunit, partial [Deltaproteobacteria bacterium]